MAITQTTSSERLALCRETDDGSTVFRHSLVQRGLGTQPVNGAPAWLAEFIAQPRWLRFGPHVRITGADGRTHEITIPRRYGLSLDVEAENAMVRALASAPWRRRYDNPKQVQGDLSSGRHVVGFTWTDHPEGRAPREVHARLELNGGALVSCEIRIGGEAARKETFHPHIVRHVVQPVAQPVAPDLTPDIWYLVAQLLPERTSLSALSQVNHAFALLCAPMTLPLQRLKAVKDTVLTEVRRLRTGDTPAEPTPLQQQTLQQVHEAYDTPVLPAQEGMRDELQRPVAREMNRWADRLHDEVARYGVALDQALGDLLDDAGHLPAALLRMAAPRLALHAATLMVPLQEMTAFVDRLLTLDATPPDPQVPSAEQIVAALACARPQDDARNQGLIDAWLADAARRPPAFEGVALAVLAMAVQQVGVAHTEVAGGRPPYARRLELMDRLEARRAVLPGEAATPLTLRMQAAALALDPTNRDLRRQHLH